MNDTLWERYTEYLCDCPSIGLSVDISRMKFSSDFLARMESSMQNAFSSMAALESGAIANRDENRMVGHYWLRTPDLSPTSDIRDSLFSTVRSIRDFTFSVHTGKIYPRKRSRFTRFLCIGIGGSALGPQLIADALGSSADKIKPHFLDNTDPDGISRVLADIGDDLVDTMIIVISKSGGTIETRNGMLEVAAACKKANISFERHAVAITGAGSKLDDLAVSSGWLARFPMWDWVGGRTSVLSAVGLLPAALQGINIDSLLKGASRCDAVTRNRNTRQNPAALLSLMWFHATGGAGKKDMVILPYRDRLVLFPKYLQQLVMESLGKELDLSGKVVNQGISVYGNKGTTDQHAYVQQLRDGLNNFFATFIEVLHDGDTSGIDVDPGIRSGDYLNSFLHGTRSALYEKNRESITVSLDRLDAESLGALIALYERSVGFYASLINVNAYHQPGVEAGKKMAGVFIKLQGRVLSHLYNNWETAFSADDLATALEMRDSIESIYKILEHVSANPSCRVIKTPGKRRTDSVFKALPAQ